MNKTSEKDDDLLTFLLVFIGLLLFIGIILYVLSLGRVNLVSNREAGTSFQENRQFTKEKAEELEEKLRKSKKRARKYSRIYYAAGFLFRLLELGALACYNIFFVLMYIGTHSPVEILAWNTLLALVVTAIVYLFTGDYKEVKNLAGFYNDVLKVKIYGSALGVEKVVLRYEEALKEQRIQDEER